MAGLCSAPSTCVPGSSRKASRTSTTKSTARKTRSSSRSRSFRKELQLPQSRHLMPRWKRPKLRLLNALKLPIKQLQTFLTKSEHWAGLASFWYRSDRLRFAHIISFQFTINGFYVETSLDDIRKKKFIYLIHQFQFKMD